MPRGTKNNKSIHCILCQMPRCPGTGKVMHKGELGAIMHLENLRCVQPRYDGKVYLCPLCKHYHVGHRRHGESRERRKLGGKP